MNHDEGHSKDQAGDYTCGRENHQLGHEVVRLGGSPVYREWLDFPLASQDIICQMKAEKEKRTRPPDQAANEFARSRDESTEEEFAFDNPAEINTTPDITAFDPKHLPEKS